MRHSPHYYPKRDCIILTVALALILVGCFAPPAAITTNTRPPSGATNMTNVHNGWVTFEWRGECFLMKSGGKGSFGIGHITTIDCGDEDEDQ